LPHVVALGVGECLSAGKSESVVRAISFQDFQPDPPSSQTDDMQSQYRALPKVHPAVKISPRFADGGEVPATEAAL